MSVLAAALLVVVAIPLVAWLAGARKGRRFPNDNGIGRGEASDPGSDGDE